MSFNKLFKVLDDDVKLTSLITNLSNGYIEVPYIINETFNALEDGSPYLNIINDGNKRSLCIMIDQYFTNCYEYYIDDLNLDKLLEYGKIEIYKVDAKNGIRYATQNEVAYGIKGLIAEQIYPAGEEAYKNLCLLQWTFTGRNYYFRQAGYKLDYDSNGKVITSFYQMIQMSALDLKTMFDWLSDKEKVDTAIKKIKKMQKSKGYKYASYEKDEITEDITIKQLVHDVVTFFPKNSTNPDYRKGIALALKSYKRKQILTPLEVSVLRSIYDNFAKDNNRNESNNEQNVQLREMCEELLRHQYEGKINPNHFAYRIVETLKKSNYSQCSPKQYNILLSACNILELNKDNKKVEDNTHKTEILTDSDMDLGLDILSDAIGSGLFEEDGD